jgi:predicted RNA-binding protein with PUA-like domain
MQYWLFKSEPNNFSITNLAQSPQQTTAWDGVRNYQARNFLRDQIKANDLALFYHSSCKQPGVVGTMTIVSAAYPDPSAFIADSSYYDPQSCVTKPRWYLVKVKLHTIFAQPVLLTVIKQQVQLRNMLLVRPGNRLSIMPVTAAEWQVIMALAIQ